MKAILAVSEDFGIGLDDKLLFSDKHDNKLLQRGLVFLNKKDTIANAKAMLGIDTYEVVCEIQKCTF